MTDTDRPLDRRWADMLFGIRRSIRYHQRRRAFFDRCDQWGNVISLIFGSAAIYGVLDKDYHALALIASALVTIISAINLVYGSAQRARLHHDLSREYSGLERQMVGAPSEDVLLRVTDARLEIEADEPPVLHVLNVICHNELLRAERYPRDLLAKVTWWQRFWAPVIDFREDRIVDPGSTAAPADPDQRANASAPAARPVRRRVSRRRGVR
ncbi:hypothetical protein [Paraburkholderia solisilvae]|uniref:SMODS and SLOG-associating 2TM effector domain-containing protein n=1 Tax=Paraburkholderia solisilvae TaxID=624376 RepID=A0A6J5EVA2_9BURK|nr:hypothetical protein [Paraburkholderia solisilvae]CAB3770489.1 hypothetical protein LMG29739_05798 [Paraburkholderia solisilvae]